MLFDSPLLANPEYQMKIRIFHAIDAPISHLSVKRICENAGISRDTFYRHFDSKYDIILWHGRLVQSIYLDQAGRSIDLYTGYYHDLRLLAEEMPIYSIALIGMGHHVEEFIEMHVHRRETLVETLTNYRGIEIDEELSFIIDYFVMLETLLVVRWLIGGAKPDPSVFAERIISVIPPRLHEALLLQ